MDKDISYSAKFSVKCLLYLERQLRKRRRKLSMANRDESLDQTATISASYENSSNNGSCLIGLESLAKGDASFIGDKGDMCNESKVFNGPEGSRPKKSLFEITSVESTGNRGESGGIEAEDAELDETLTDIQEVSSTFEDKSKGFSVSAVEESAKDKILSSNSNGSDVSQAHTSSVGLTSRFKIVKVARAEPYRRGRWSCQEFMDTSSEIKPPDRNVSEPRLIASNVHHAYSLAQENRDQTKLDRKDLEQKLLPESGQNAHDGQYNINSSEPTSGTSDKVAVSNKSLIESLESQAEQLANFVEG